MTKNATTVAHASRTAEVPALRPIGARVILRLVPEPGTTPGGLLYVPETARARPQRGVVVAVGPGREFPSGYVAPSGLQPGDEVVFNRYAELPVWDDKTSDHTLVAVSQEEVLCVLEPCDEDLPTHIRCASGGSDGAVLVLDAVLGMYVSPLARVSTGEARRGLRDGTFAVA